MGILIILRVGDSWGVGIFTRGGLFEGKALTGTGESSKLKIYKLKDVLLRRNSIKNCFLSQLRRS